MGIAVIPSYNPDLRLISLVNELRDSGVENIIVVNDGSGEKEGLLFQNTDLKAIVLEHSYNRGKGAALKTAFHYISENFTERESIVTVDGDGQHCTEDVVSILNIASCQREKLIMGVREFSKDVPFRSRIGNKITRYIFRLLSGKWVSDTQTGLRAFTSELIPLLLSIDGSRYEYEMNMLAACTKMGVPIIEQPIQTIYHDNENSCSHFRAIRDSIRIYGNLLVFAGTSFVSFLADYILFFLFVGGFTRVLSDNLALVLGNIAARFISAGLNYYLNHTFVFKSAKGHKKTFVQYAILAGSILFLNSFLLYMLNSVAGIAKALSKVITELGMFSISFLFQKYIIFKKEEKFSRKERVL